MTAIALREVCALIDTHSKIVDRESRRQERAAATVSVNAVFGFVELLTQQVVVHVSDPAERAAIAKSFRKALTREGLADLVHDADPDSSDTDEIPPPTLLDVVRRSFRAADAPHA